ncbi:MAG: hypothetical protein IJB70_01830 [Clostridia bacterium]|nr:hypothetical protein [Clostridia bacterium]
MKKFISVLLVITIIISTGVVYADVKAGERHFMPGDLLFDTMPDSDISLMGEDSFEDVIKAGWDNMEECIDVSEFQIKISDFQKAYGDVLFSNPEYFYVLGPYYYRDDDEYVTDVEPIYGITDKEQIENTLEEIEAVSEEILFLISENMTDFDKVMTVHDYMVEHFSYDWDFYYDSANTDPGTYYHQFTLEIMTKKLGVCQGYTLAFTYMMNKLGIETRYVSSDVMNHAWNLVKVDGEWYHIDVTWDDSDDCGEVHHEYELISTGCIQTLPNPHYGFDLGEFEADSTRFDDAPWHESLAEVAYCHGKAYWIDGDRLVDEDGNVIYDNLAGVDEKWNFEGNWIVEGMVFSGLAEYNGKLFFNTDKAIYTYNPHTGETLKVMDKISVGGLYVDKNVLVYANAIIKEDTEGAYIYIEEGGRIVLEHARFAEPYIKDDKIIARVYKECDDEIFVLAKSAKGIEAEVITNKGYSTVSFSSDAEADIFYWTSNLKPLRDVEEIIVY